MTFRVSIIGEDTPILKRVQQFARDYPDLARQSVFTNIVPFVDRRVEIQLRRNVPGPAKKPIQWTSEKQRRWFFWTFSDEDLPYRRTGKLPAAWEVLTRVTENGLTISIVNDNPAAPFVYGRWKQQFHTNTGWPAARPIIDSIAAATRPVLVSDQLLLASAMLGRQ